MALLEAAMIGAGTALVAMGGVLRWAARTRAWEGVWEEEPGEETTYQGIGVPRRVKEKPREFGPASAAAMRIFSGATIQSFETEKVRARKSHSLTAWWRYWKHSGGLIMGYPVDEWAMTVDWVRQVVILKHPKDRDTVRIPFERFVDYARQSR